MQLPTAGSSARRLNTAAAILAAGVLTDSAAEHYRAGFHNRAMFVAPVVAGAALFTTVRTAFQQNAKGSARTAALGSAVLTGLVGLAFHVTNISRRTGGWSSANVFVGAPIAAPLAITMAGLLGMAGDRVEPRSQCRRRLAIFVSALSTLGLIGTSTEAGVLHFRGAFQNPFMYAPVAAPPIAAAVLAGATLSRSARMHRGRSALSANVSRRVVRRRSPPSPASAGAGRRTAAGMGER